MVGAAAYDADLVEINLGSRILLGSSYYEDWTEQEMFVDKDPLGNPVDRRHPWNQHTNPKPQKRDMDDKYSWVMSPRWFDGKDYLTLTPALVLWPGILISLSVLCVNFIGDGLRDALDPRMRKG